ncbi:MAG: hypothetical protein K8S23_03490 [Candidatus Cloacimonetes bacterium]|nr:hypothetical protein [Candidatus Cloacimonadota bacterium]
MNRNFKNILLIIILFISLFLSAQVITWEDTFNENNGWTLESNWTIQSGMLQFYYSPTAENFDLSAIFPEIELPENVGDIVISQYISTYSIVDEVAEISVIGEDFETIIWSYELLTGDWGEFTGSNLILSLHEFAGSTINLQIKCYGASTWNLNNWNVYNIQIYEMFDNDLAALKIVGPPNAEQNIEDMWSVKVKNVGMNPQEDFIVRLYHEEEEIASIISEEVLITNEEMLFSFFWIPTEFGDTYFTGEIIFDDDDFQENNLTSQFDVNIFEEGALQILVWDNDFESHITDPETGETVGCEYSIQKALSTNSIFYVGVNILPEIIYNYDAIIVTLGLYCVG